MDIEPNMDIVALRVDVPSVEQEGTITTIVILAVV